MADSNAVLEFTPGGPEVALGDRLPLGVATLDPHLTLQRCNPAWIEMVERVVPAMAGHVAPGMGLFDLLPDLEPSFSPALACALAGQPSGLEELGVEGDGGTFFWDVTLVPRETGIVAGFVDVTQRVLARRDLERQLANRTRELSALHDVMSAANESLDLDKVLDRSLGQVLRVMRSQVGAIHLLDEDGEMLQLAASQGISPQVVASITSVPVEDGLAGWTVEREEPLVVPSVADGPRPLLAIPAAETQAYVGVPVRARRRPVGVLSVVGQEGHSFSPAEVSLLAAIADQVGTAVENARLYRQAEQLAVVRERERLARELHDSVTQSLYSLTLMAEAGRRLAGAGDLARVEGYLERLGEISQQALKEMRLLVYELRPLVLKREGLVGALQQRLDAVERRAGVETRLLTEGQIVLPTAVEEALYRVAQEALNNALKHAAASHVTISIRSTGDRVELEVADNGRGFAPDLTGDKGGLGLVSMQERVDRLRGSLAVRSAPGGGTTVTVGVDLSP